LQREGISHERLTPQQQNDIEPAVSEARSEGSIVAATYVPDEAQLRNPRHLQALAAACRMRGVTIEESVEVLDFVIDRGRATAVATTAGIQGGGSFCITTGAWTSALAAKLGLELAVVPIRGQMVLFSGPRPTLAHIINVGRRYLVPRKDGRVLAGSTEEDSGFDRATTESGIRGLLEFAWSLIPEWRGATVEQTWAGLRPGTPDGLPYLDRLPDCENVFIAAGQYRGGIYLSPGTARVMSELIRGERPSIDLSRFRLNR
jgi:glycine oxidase